MSTFADPASDDKHLEIAMATNTGKGHRTGAVAGRTQVRQPNGNWQKRNERTGEFMERKATRGPFKGVAKEPDGRDTMRRPERPNRPR
jgi:hypothetical protein